MVARSPLVIGADGLPQQLQPADTLSGTLGRIGIHTATCNASGVATFVWTYSVVLMAWIKVTWSGQQMICGDFTTYSATGGTAQGMVSRGTLALSSGPFTTAPSGAVLTAIVVGN
ncbi:hypothetical protein [Methylobacterium oryzisoli]|uniref:hypothetical protein n=1 Tax=Methylobacterium oryzisoli TaxID=3385502 RepID=UPI003892C219